MMESMKYIIRKGTKNGLKGLNLSQGQLSRNAVTRNPV